MGHPWDEKWIVGKSLGKGGQGITKQVTYREDPKIQGALKYLKNNSSLPARGRMFREVSNLRALAALAASVPRVLDDNTTDFEKLSTELYVVMDLVPGPTLADYIEDGGPLDLDTSLTICLELCKAVGIGHSASPSILHRDIKPQNIILRDSDTTKAVLIDYGLSFNLDDDSLTKTSETFRNEFLALPEANTPAGDKRDRRSDLTATCAILFYCITGKSVGQLQDASGALPHLRDGAHLALMLQSDARRTQVESLLTKGLSVDIANRFQDYRELESQLKAVLDSSKTIDDSDPFQVALQASKRLREKSRVMQLAEFRDKASVLFNLIQREPVKYNSKLGYFSIAQIHVTLGNDYAVPLGCDFVAPSPTMLMLQAQNHDIRLCRLYAVASKGEKCYLLAYDEITSANSWNVMKASVKSNITEEVAAYDGDPAQIYQLFSISFRKWVANGIARLTEIIEDDKQPMP